MLANTKGREAPFSPWGDVGSGAKPCVSKRLLALTGYGLNKVVFADCGLPNFSVLAGQDGPLRPAFCLTWSFLSGGGLSAVQKGPLAYGGDIKVVAPCRVLVADIPIPWTIWAYLPIEEPSKYTIHANYPSDSAVQTSELVQTQIITPFGSFLLRTSAIRACSIALGLASVRVCTKIICPDG